MPRVHAVCALLAILLLTMPVPESHAAPSTSISELQYPAHVVLGTSKYADGIPVTFQVHWAGARKNDLLLLGVLDDQTQDFAEGSTNITGCLSSRGGILFEKRGLAYCALLLPGPPEGWASAAFHLKLQQVGTHYLSAEAMLADSYGRTRAGSVSLSQKFSVEISSSVSLTVKVPAGVTVTLDGVAQQTGIVSASVVPGSHTMSIPDLVPVDSETQLRFDRWTDGTTSSNRLVTLEDDAQFEAAYVRQFLLTATSTYGNATGTGWYDEGTTATLSVVTPQPMSGLYGLLGGKYVFSRWSGGSTANTPTASVKMDGPKTVTAVWSMDYRTPVIAFAVIIIIMLMPLLYVFRKGKAAPTPPVQQPAWPSAERVAEPAPEVVRTETPVSAAIASPLTTQKCSCGRSKEHLHYSSNHDTAVNSSLVLVLVIEALSFVSGSVKGSIRLYPSQSEIYAYNYVASRIAEATAPYERWNTIAMGAELLVILLLIVSAATLRSTTKQGLHRVAVYGAVAGFLSRWGAYALYDSLAAQAVSRLNIEPDLLRTANDVQSQFVAAAGFWDSQAFNLMIILISLVLLVLLAFAAWELYTSKVVSVWPSVQPRAGTVEPEAIPATAPSAPMPEPSVVVGHVQTKFCESCGSEISAESMICPDCGHRNVSELLAQQQKPTKFCRFCGAKIPRVSKYCEECGKNLI